MLSSCKYLCSYVNRYLLTCFVYLNQTENSKKKKFYTNPTRCLYVLGMNETTFVFMFLINACSEFHFFEYACNKFGIVNDSRLLLYYLPKKGFHGNFGSIFDFLGIPTKVDFKVTASQ